MKVVLFCGGFGMRMREYSESIPKPMVKIGYRPILWHIMKYYAHFRHNDFVLCLGSQANAIKEYFLNHDECVSNDVAPTGIRHEAPLAGLESLWNSRRRSSDAIPRDPCSGISARSRRS